MLAKPTRLQGRRRISASALAFFTSALLSAAPATAETLKVATWNLENLRQASETGFNKRSDRDYVRLSIFADMLDADIVALQEVENEAAVQRVFAADRYDVFLSRRPIDPDHRQPIRTGFVVRRGLSVEHNDDLKALNVTGALRHGTDITVTVEGHDIRLLAVHLKSGCWGDPLSSNDDACQKLSRQVPELEAWIDVRSAERAPYIVLGDFNRRFDVPTDTFWTEIDDANPVNANLTRVTFGRRSGCWESEFSLYIDHIVLGRQTSRWVQPGSFTQLLYEQPEHLQEVLSDHCLLAVTLEIPE